MMNSSRLLAAGRDSVGFAKRYEMTAERLTAAG
jgi:hypothetical protein